MAARTNLLAVGSSDASSADQSVDSAATVTLELIGSGPAKAPRDAVVLIELKGSDGNYRAAPSLELSGSGLTTVQLNGPLAAYRVHRVRGTVGVDVVV